jgi:hypothetical protein
MTGLVKCASHGSWRRSSAITSSNPLVTDSHVVSSRRLMTIRIIRMCVRRMQRARQSNCNDDSLDTWTRLQPVQFEWGG